MDKIKKYLLQARKGAAKPPKFSPPAVAPAPALPTVKSLRKAPLAFDAEERALRDEKLQFIQLCLAEKQRGKAWPDAALLIASRDAALMPRLSGRGLLTYDNLRKWREVLGKTADGSPNWSNRDALLRNYGRDTERQGDPAFWTAVLACYLNTQHPKLAKIYRKFAVKWRERYPSRAVPSVAAVRYYIARTFPRRLKALARDGENAFQQRFRDYIERDPETIRPNECWVADSRTLDFMVRVDVGGKWVPVRPQVCTILDVKSEYVVSCQLVVDSVTNAVIRNGLGDGISKYGRPSVFLIDNGADYCAAGFTTPVIFTPKVSGGELHAHSIMKALDIEVRTALPYNAQTKVVERFFREMMEDDAFRRGYVGNTPANRPASAEVWSKPENCNRLMSVQQAAEAIDDFIRAYHSKPSSGKYCKGLTPAQAFAPELRLTRPNLSLQEYFMAFLKPLSRSRVVDPRGPSVVCGKFRYVAVDRHALWPYDGKPVMVKFDNVNANRCFVFSLDGKFLTECRRPEYVPYFARTDEERGRLSAALKRRESERQELKALIMSETKGFHKLDPATIYLLDADTREQGARLQLIDRRTSVKGETHNPAIYAAPGEAAPLPSPAAAAPLPGSASRPTLPEPPPEAVRKADPDRVRLLNQILKQQSPII